MNSTSRSTRLPEIGDLVVCQDSGFRASMHLPSEPGLVTGLRKDQAQVFFPSVFGHSFIPAYALARVRNPATAPVPAWMQRVWYLARTLDAVALEVERFGDDGNAVRIFHGEILVEVVDRVREDLGAELCYYSMAPSGMHKMETSIGFVTSARPCPVPRPGPRE